MSTAANGTSLVERTDIHKSCKAIETLVNVLNDYCEAVGLVVSLQKKLAKSLKETAVLKATGEVAANAMQTSAGVFEALSEVDTKFAKVADKEYDAISSEVKKWFKKLAKEEKMHDDKLSTVNAKIKQAGMAYEKKSKRKTLDATEEHTRYMNLISTLGPEVTQEKYNHSLSVTQKHTATTYNVAASLSRLADAEWQKSCECVRRFSPSIGPLQEWRAFCEGGWTGPMPQDLPGLTPTMTGSPTTPLKTIHEDPISLPQETAQAPTESAPRQSMDHLAPPQARDYISNTPTGSPSTSKPVSASNSPTISHHSPKLTPSAEPSLPGSRKEPDSDVLRPPKLPLNDPATGSVRSLSAFPAPPTHFPIPPARQQQSSISQFQPSSNGSSQLSFPFAPRQLAESPISNPEEFPSTQDLRAQPLTTPIETHTTAERFTQQQQYTPPLEVRRPVPLRSAPSVAALEAEYQKETALQAQPRQQRHVASTSLDRRPPPKLSTGREEFHLDEKEEFGVTNSGISTRARTFEGFSRASQPVEKTDTGTSTTTNGSIVAAMRSRYAGNSGASSPPPPRELPRIPLSVNNLAARYQAPESPTTPYRNHSPPMSRQHSMPVIASRVQAGGHEGQYANLGRVPPPSRDQGARDAAYEDRQHYREAEERRQRDADLREREMELERRARELDRERAKLQTLREGETDGDRDGEFGEQRRDLAGGESMSGAQQGQFGLRPRERRVSLRSQLQRPLSQMQLDDHSASLGQPGPNLRDQRSRNQLSPPSAAMASTPPSTSPRATPRQLSSPSSPRKQPSVEPRYERRASNERYVGAGQSTTNPPGDSVAQHAPYCGCEQCSVNKYKSASSSSSGKHASSGSPVAQKFPASAYGPIENKPPGKSKPNWIRRLSMPVGSAFGSGSGSDAKKHHQNNLSTSSVASSIYASGGGGESNGVYPSGDRKRNLSAVALTGRISSSGLEDVQEDGRLQRGGAPRLYEGQSGHRSVTNLVGRR